MSEPATMLVNQKHYIDIHLLSSDIVNVNSNLWHAIMAMCKMINSVVEDSVTLKTDSGLP